MSIGYVVIEWNQASHRPRVSGDGALYDSEDEAREIAARDQHETDAVGRRERWTVAEVVEIEAGS